MFIKLFSVFLFILCVVGYILNVVKLIGMAGLTGMLVVRVIGIFFPPLGVIAGYF